MLWLGACARGAAQHPAPGGERLGWHQHAAAQAAGWAVRQANSLKINVAGRKRHGMQAGRRPGQAGRAGSGLLGRRRGQTTGVACLQWCLV